MDCDQRAGQIMRKPELKTEWGAGGQVMKSKCSQDHEEIEFECSRSALCPLCAMREQLTKVKNEALAEKKAEYISLVSDAVANASAQENALNEEIVALRKNVESLEMEVKITRTLLRPLENKKFSEKQVLILVLAVIAGIAFMETSFPVWTVAFLREFLLKLIGYAVVSEFVVIMLARDGKADVDD